MLAFLRKFLYSHQPYATQSSQTLAQECVKCSGHPPQQLFKTRPTTAHDVQEVPRGEMAHVRFSKHRVTDKADRCCK